MRERGALPKEEGDAIGEYKAVHEENSLSSWLREDGKHKEERVMEVDKRRMLKEDVAVLLLWRPFKF